MSTLMTHEEAWEQIPWYVNGRADESIRAQVEAHARHCEECRAEVTLQRQIMSAIASDTRIDCVPGGVSFQKLWDRVRAEDLSPHRNADISAPSADIPASLLKPSPPRSITRWLAVAVVVEAVGITALTAALYSRDAPRGAEYQTVTSSALAPSNGIIRAVFTPSLSVDELQHLLEKNGLKIVAGPTEAGVYTLAAAAESAGSAHGESALATLRADPAVRFAEPIAK